MPYLVTFLQVRQKIENRNYNVHFGSFSSTIKEHTTQYCFISCHQNDFYNL